MKTASLALLLVACVFGANAQAFEPLFETRIDYRLEDRALYVTAADLNGDSYEDLIYVPAVDEIRVMLNLGNGTFDTAAAYRVGREPRSVAALDMDSDADLDLAVINNSGDCVTILMNRGAGIFNPVSNITTLGRNPASICTGDFNEDGLTDMAVAVSYHNAVDIMLSQGDLTFSQSLAGGFIYYPTSVVTADFNGDSHLDLAAACYNNDTVGVSLGAGDGTFGTVSLYHSRGGPRMIAAGDFNGDGLIDLVTANMDSNYIGVMFNTGAGVFGSAFYYTAGSACRSVAVCNLDGDQFPDLVTANYNDGMSVLINNGDGTFGQPRNYSLRWDQPRNVFPSDFDNDGNIDIVVSLDYNYFPIRVYKGNGDGTLAVGDMQYLARRLRSYVAGDFNGDGCIDLAAANSESLYFCPGACDLSFTSISGTTMPDTCQNMVTSDFNGDGNLDIATIFNDGFNILGIYLNDGNGNFAFDSLYTGRNPHNYDEIACADFNGDHAPDIIGCFLDDSLTIWLNRGGGKFHDALKIEAGNGYNLLFTAADLNLDGYADLTVGNRNSGIVSILANDGTVSFYTVATMELTGLISGISNIDYDRNGLPDLIVTTAVYRLITNQGGWSFGQAQELANHLGILGTFDDMDLDGDFDLVEFTLSNDRVYTAINTGGVFEYGNHSYFLPRLGGQGAFVDGDNDGDTDVLLMAGYDSLIVLTNHADRYVSISDPPSPLPEKTSLMVNFPNPFNARTVISYALSEPGEVSLSIYNLLGQRVATPVDGFQKAGEYMVAWDGAPFSSGVYFARLEAGERAETVKMVLLK